MDVTLQGSATLDTTSAADGTYSVANVPSGNWTVAPHKNGDRGTALSALDAAYVLQAVAGLRQLDPEQMIAADVTGDGTVSALDASRILQYVVGLRAQLPAAQLCASDWLFVPAPAALPAAMPIPPALGGSTCQPGAIGLDSLAGDASSEDFHAVLIGDVTGNWQPSP